ncbi:uncharacterized protein LOC111895511 [Lactuca sativa]|uniref:Retrotransposon gag domain-containing protein n=1 Tax=Lactuca sativa TaxID=4236 RepID=A0A9R1UIH5_LACSA|nr:uncharacterized protein LOC111895511 [Lactuca sativa]KAJ0187876.1 hypothetical protein LSAT_V11C900464130 [Lactuca sativa]
MDQDQGHLDSRIPLTSVNDLNKVVSDVVSMSKTMERLGARVEYLEGELPKFLKTQHLPSIIPKNLIEPQLLIRPFSEHFDLRSFCCWLEGVEDAFDYCFVPEDEQVDVVSCKFLPGGEASKWWKRIQDLSMQVDKKHRINWHQMKRLLMAKFISPDCLLDNKKSQDSF